MPIDLLPLTREEMQLPSFYFNEVEALYFYDLTIPGEVYDAIAAKERAPLIEDLKKVLSHAIEKVNIFKPDEVDPAHTYAPWHSLFLLKDLEATEALPDVLNFLQQEEDIVHIYLGDGIAEFGWELLYTLAHGELPLLADLFKKLVDEYDIRKAIVETLEQICLHQPGRTLEVQGHLRVMLLHLTSLELSEDIFADELGVVLLETIGELQLTRLFPEIKTLFAEGKMPSLLMMDWEDFEQFYITNKPGAPEPAALRTREEIYAACLLSFTDTDEDEDEDDIDEDDFFGTWEEDDIEDDEDGEGNSATYIDHEEVRTPYVKTGPDIGRNDPCPCGSGKKYKKCCGK